MKGKPNDVFGPKFPIFQAELNSMLTKSKPFQQVNHMDTFQTVRFGR